MTKFKTPVNYNDLTNPMFYGFKAYSIDDKSKYITLISTSFIEKFDDNGKYIGDEFTFRILENGLNIKVFMTTHTPFSIFKVGTETYGFKINRDK